MHGTLRDTIGTLGKYYRLSSSPLHSRGGRHLLSPTPTPVRSCRLLAHHCLSYSSTLPSGGGKCPLPPLLPLPTAPTASTALTVYGSTAYRGLTRDTCSGGVIIYTGAHPVTLGGGITVIRMGSNTNTLILFFNIK